MSDWTCPVCAQSPKSYAPWYKASRGTLAGHLYNAHQEELRQRLHNPDDSVIEALRRIGLGVSRGAAGDVTSIKIKTIRQPSAQKVSRSRSVSR